MSDNFSSLPPISNFALSLVDILDGVSYRPVVLSNLEDPVFKLRYEAYRREEFIAFNSLGICTDDLDNEPNAYCYGLYINDRLVSSLRLHHVTPHCRTSPAIKVYPDIMHPLLDKGCTFIDPSRFTADHEASLAFPSLPFLTLRLAMVACHFFKATYCLATPRPEHQAFYRRVFLAEEIGGIRPYPGLEFPIALYGAKVAKTLPKLYARYPFFRSTKEEQFALFGERPDPRNPRFVKPSVRQVFEKLTDDTPA